jgi:hypothetical protein
MHLFQAAPLNSFGLTLLDSDLAAPVSSLAAIHSIAHNWTTQTFTRLDDAVLNNIASSNLLDALARWTCDASTVHPALTSLEPRWLRLKCALFKYKTYNKYSAAHMDEEVSCFMRNIPFCSNFVVNQDDDNYDLFIGLDWPEWDILAEVNVSAVLSRPKVEADVLTMRFCQLTDFFTVVKRKHNPGSAPLPILQVGTKQPRSSSGC